MTLPLGICWWIDEVGAVILRYTGLEVIEHGTGPEG